MTDPRSPLLWGRVCPCGGRGGNDEEKAPCPCHPRGGGDPGYWPKGLDSRSPLSWGQAYSCGNDGHGNDSSMTVDGSRIIVIGPQHKESAYCLGEGMGDERTDLLTTRRVWRACFIDSERRSWRTLYLRIELTGKIGRRLKRPWRVQPFRAVLRGKPARRI